MSEETKPAPAVPDKVTSSIETRLQGCRLSGSSDTYFWERPAALWRDEAYGPSWYSHAKMYWDDAVVAPPTVNGVLGGFEILAKPDALFSRAFLEGLNLPDKLVAADVAAGIGRVAKHVLLPKAARVDVVEQSASLIRAAPEFIATVDDLGGGEEGRCRFFCVPMQDWRPRHKDYDLIWIQWSVGHFTDADFVAFLNRARMALKPSGILVIKDNVLHVNTTEDLFYVDDDDRSICRSYAYYRAIFDEARATVRAEAQQPVDTHDDLAFPSDIYPVIAFALSWENDALEDIDDEHPGPDDERGDDQTQEQRRPEPPDATLRGLGDAVIFGW